MSANQIEGAVSQLTRELVKTKSSEVVHALAQAVVNIDDEQIDRGLLAALRTIEDQRCIDQVCAVWLGSRDDRLGTLLEWGGWIASGPERLALLTALKAGRLERFEQAGAEVVEPLLQASQDPDLTVAGRARQALRDLQNPAAQEEFYRLILETDHPSARELAAAVPYAPLEPKSRAIFYLLTEQWDRYDDLDFDRSLLRAAYQTGDEWLQGRIAELTRRTGRTDFVEVIAGGRQRRRLAEMTDGEWRVVLAVLSQNEGWAEMWRLAQAAPALWSAVLLQRLAEKGWLPAQAEEQAGLTNLAQLAAQCAPEGLQLDRSVRCQATLNGHAGAVLDLAISPEDGLLVSAGEDKTVRLWSLPEGQALKRLNGHLDEVWRVALSADGRLLASGSEDDTVRLWRLPDGKPLNTLHGHLEATNGLALSPTPFEGSAGEWLLATSGKDNSVRLWRLPEGKPWRTLAGHSDLVIRTAISPDGRVLASGSRDSTIRLWRLPDGAPLQTLWGHKGSVNCLAFSPNGRLLASGSLDKTVRVWRLSEGTTLHTLTGHTSAVVDVAITPGDGRLLASSSLDETIRLWQLSDGRPVATLEEHTAGVMGLAISPDGQFLASGGYDRTVRLWSSDLALLSRRPIVQTGPPDMAWVEERLAAGKLSAAERGWLDFILALVRWRRRFDIEVETAPRRIAIGAFDIEIEG